MALSTKECRGANSYEEKYQYLFKEYDSEEHGYNYHVKKFKINYEYFNEKWDYLKSSFFNQGIK